jgi:hypothetical protein
VDHLLGDRPIVKSRRTMHAVAAVAAIACLVAPALAFPSPLGAASGSNAAIVLNSVSCVNATTCFAVGATSDNPSKTLTARWNGKTWTTLPSPNPAALADVSCPSATFCMAVGNVIERWNGQAWSIVPAPTLNIAALQAVTCTSPTFCMAVGGLTERWDGKKWSVVANPKPGNPTELADVSCTSTTNCFAVGNYSSRFSFEAVALLEHWNGKTWSVVAGPTPSAPNPRLNSVSCPSASTCLALGSGDTGVIDGSTALTARWNGRSWSLVAAANVTAHLYRLASVSCTGPKNCFAVGSFDNSTNNGRPAPLIERWNGKTWSIVAPARSASGTGGWFESTSCTSPTNCLAVGASVTLISSGGYYRQKSLVERWDGKTWTTVASP